MTNRGAFWDRIATRYAASPVKDQAAYERKLEATRARLTKDMRVLEIGCGTGSTAITHAPHVAHIEATDISAKMLSIADAKAEDAGVKNITFRRASVEELALPAKSVDAVLALSLLHLLDDPEKAIGQVFQWLKPNGLFVINVVFVGEFNPLLRGLLRVGRALGFVPPLSRFTSADLFEMLTRSGFSIETYWSVSHGGFIIARKRGGGSHAST
ncbi:MAG: class I SAM-dependent methyltransferase [Alphaproteobacteria bacterium]|nr:class I SAM-dependent methyltransferase [Alphaproteobacteria bacterium SS10]